MRIDSDEFKAWHEAGHATVCLHLGGDLDCVEFLERDSRGFAVARGCEVMPEHERSVVCGGIAAEIYLLQAGFVDGIDLRDSRANAAAAAQILSNAWRDHQAFIGRAVTQDNDFTKGEKEEFIRYAIERVVPIVDLYFATMRLVVSELLATRKIEGARVKELLQIGTPR